MASDGSSRPDHAAVVTAPSFSQGDRPDAQAAADYLWDAEVGLAKIDRLLGQGPLDGSPESADRLRDILDLVQEIRCEAGTHDYHLVSTVGASLLDYAEKHDAPEAGRMPVVEIHLEALKTVILSRITGQGGDRGKALIAGIKAVVAKFAGP